MNCVVVETTCHGAQTRCVDIDKEEDAWGRLTGVANPRPPSINYVEIGMKQKNLSL
jgi:hypothetical protein